MEIRRKKSDGSDRIGSGESAFEDRNDAKLGRGCLSKGFAWRVDS